MIFENFFKIARALGECNVKELSYITSGVNSVLNFFSYKPCCLTILMAWPYFDHRCLWSCYLHSSCCWHSCDLGDQESYLGSDAGLQGLDPVGRRQWNCCQSSHHRHWSVWQGYRSKWTVLVFSRMCKKLVLKSAVTCNKAVAKQTFRYSRQF